MKLYYIIGNIYNNLNQKIIKHLLDTDVCILYIHISKETLNKNYRY